MKLKLSHRQKDNLLKLFTLMVTLSVLIISVLIMHRVVRASAVEETELVSGMALEVTEDVVIEEKESEPEKDQLISEAGSLLEFEPDESESGKGFFSDVAEYIVESGEAFGDFSDSVVDLLDFGTEDDYSGAPSDVPPDALSRPETEAIIEPKSELETEVSTESKQVDFSEYSYDESMAVALAQLMWAEARGCSMREQSLVAWTVLNRVDVCYDGRSDFWSILTAPYQFAYYSGNPYEEYEYRIAVDVLQRWAAEKDGVEDSGRTLPKGYLYYYGDGVHNYFGMNGFSNELWFGLGDPYENWQI